MEIDIDAKIPIIRVDSDENIVDIPALQPNGVTTNLAKPSFRRVPDAAYKKRTHKVKRRKDTYLHYIEPSPETLLSQIEYDMDLEDKNWLEQFNETVGKQNQFTISVNDFEKIMDRLEKESYFENMKSGRGAGPVVDEEAVCAICDDGDCSNANVILFCDLCDLAVHQECYGVPYIPEGQWLCRRCLKSPMRNVECCLCPNLGGAFKQTDDNRWAHVICALWIPEVCFANTVFLEPIDSINQIPAARWKLVCYICKQRKKGACIQCHKNNCYQPFHVTCARGAGLYMRISTCKYPSADGGTYTDVKKEAYCDMHAPPGSVRRGGGMYSGDETDEDIDTDDYRKKDMERKKRIKKTRKKLAEQREEYYNKETAIVKVDEKKFSEIANQFGVRGKRCIVNKHLYSLAYEYVVAIHRYWQLKRIARNGVPLLRRLQVSFNGSTSKPSGRDLDTEKYEKLRYDLEQCRLLLGIINRREIQKRKAFQVSKEIVRLKLKIIDEELPPDDDDRAPNSNGFRRSDKML